MTRLLAVAALRLREGVSARLGWLVVVAFAVGLGAALWAQGPDAAARAAKADRVALWTAWGLALVVGAVVPALGLPADVRGGAAQTLLAAPVSRLELVAGGVLGYGALSTLLLAGMGAAAVLGMQVGGLGAEERDPLRPVVAAEPLDARPDGTVVVDGATPSAAFRFRVPAGLDGDEVRVRFAPRPVVETGLERATTAVVSVHRPGGDELHGRRVEFKASSSFAVRVPLRDLRAGDEAEVVFRRETGRWKFVFGPGAVEVGGARRLFALGVLQAAMCLAPLLFLLAAASSLGAARFGAPTAVVVATFFFLAFVGRSTIVEGAEFIVQAAGQSAADDPHDHDHDHDHDHGAGPGAEVTPGRVLLARCALAVCSVVPRIETFDRTDALVERRAPTAGDLGRAAAEGLPAAAFATALAWLLLRRRELPAN